MYHFPDEIILHILRFLDDTKQLIIAMGVSKQFRHIVRTNPELWRSVHVNAPFPFLGPVLRTFGQHIQTLRVCGGEFPPSSAPLLPAPLPLPAPLLPAPLLPAPLLHAPLPLPAPLLPAPLLFAPLPLPPLPLLCSLHLQHVNVRCIDAICLEQLTSLDLTGSQFQHWSLALSARATNLTSLNVSDTGIAPLLWLILHRCVNLTSLCAANNQIGVWRMGDVPALTHLQTLDLGNNDIGMDSATTLAKALLGTTRLTSLSLRNNPIGGLGAAIVCSALLHATNLVALNFASCDLDDHAALVISVVMGEATRLESLDVSDNFRLGVFGLCALLHCAAPPLHHLSISLGGGEDAEEMRLVAEEHPHVHFFINP